MAFVVSRGILVLGCKGSALWAGLRVVFDSSCVVVVAAFSLFCRGDPKNSFRKRQKGMTITPLSDVFPKLRQPIMRKKKKLFWEKGKSRHLEVCAQEP